MIVLLPIFLLAVGVFVATVVLPHWKPRELRGDWWSRFENEFSVYAAEQELVRKTRPHSAERRMPQPRRSGITPPPRPTSSP